MLGSITFDLDPVDRGRGTVGGLGLRRYCVLPRIMLCGLGYFPAGWVRRGPPARVAQGGLVGTPGLVSCSVIKCPVPRGTQILYPAVVDLPEGYGLETVGRLTTKVRLMMRRTLEDQQ
ncbi:hypothetical protein M9H77_31567 [Catharanthus roseus]|uniref:Uncharacterized protein n=1 Tax=Catharanthus roseus TaxID=4058 RepID=A0ACC0A2B5_CATRO|nr:hypothetical protein M9H77_31567 [Catharanthus roseus]